LTPTISHVCKFLLFIFECHSLASNPFASTILFFQDLTFVDEEIDKAEDKLSSLKSLLNEINSSLPSCVYLPFIKGKFLPSHFNPNAQDYLRYHAVLSIVVNETKVFSTKTRAPFELCIELFRPQEELGYQFDEIFNTQNETSHPKLLAWAKAKLRFNHLHSSPFREHPKDIKKSSSLGQVFDLSRLNAQVSIPKILKVNSKFSQSISKYSPELSGYPKDSGFTW